DRRDDLMSWHQRQLRVHQLAVDDMKVGPTDAARVHAQQQLGRAGGRARQLRAAQRPTGMIENHRLHGSSVELIVYGDHPSLRAAVALERGMNRLPVSGTTTGSE